MTRRSSPFEIGAAIAVTIVSAAMVIMSSQHAPPPAAEKPTPVTAEATVETPAAPVERPRIDVVFVLDTTGSMSGLIEGAKRKIWAIANRLASGQPQPEIRIGFVAYRDRGDEYITRSYQLTSDIDEAYANLLSLQTAGGGDTPEHVNQALSDAIRTMPWSEQSKTLKLVFLVGDAPPHDDYNDGLNSTALVQEAHSKGIIVNTVRCGTDPTTETAWRSLASVGGGQYTSIVQDGGMVAVDTPYDAKLRELGNALNSTVMAYGSSTDKANSAFKMSNRAKMSAHAAAEAASYSAKSKRMNKEDLLGAIDGGVALDSIAEEELPSELQALEPGARKDVVAKKQAARKRLQAEIMELTEKRDAYLNDAEKGEGFDGQVVDMLREQAADIGVAY